MKLVISRMKKINSSIQKVLYNGLKFCLVLILISTFFLSLYHTILNLDLFYIGISLLKSSLFYAVFFIISAIAIDTIKNDGWNLCDKFKFVTTFHI